MTELEALRRDGYSVVRDVLAPEEIAGLRRVLQSHFRTGGRNGYGGLFQLRGMHVVPEVARVLLSEPILTVLRRHVGGPVLLTGECDLMRNTTSGWHKDITEDMRLGADFFETPDAGVYKLALYLQDQPATAPSSLRVRPGSQLCLDGTTLAETRVGVRAGDLVIFDVRLDHAGQPATMADRLIRRAARLLSRPAGTNPELVFTRIRDLKAHLTPRHVDRLAVFMTFGPDGPATRRYESAGRHRHGAASSALAPEFEIALQDAGVGWVT